MNNFGFGYEINRYCINCCFNDFFSCGVVQENVDVCMEVIFYIQVWNCIEGFFYGVGYGGVGEQMMNFILSFGDLFFYMYYMWLDKFWWDWQVFDFDECFIVMGGSNMMNFVLVNGLFGNCFDDVL